MKKKTSIALSESTLDKVDDIADRLERSRSFLIEKIIETVFAAAGDAQEFAERVKELADEYGAKSNKTKRRDKKK